MLRCLVHALPGQSTTGTLWRRHQLNLLILVFLGLFYGYQSPLISARNCPVIQSAQKLGGKCDAKIYELLS